MNEKQQIEEMANYIDRSHWKIEQDSRGCNLNSREIAEFLYNADYRKQSEGEWKKDRYGNTKSCSICGNTVTFISKYCPECGAKMKGGKECKYHS